MKPTKPASTAGGVQGPVPHAGRRRRGDRIEQIRALRAEAFRERITRDGWAVTGHFITEELTVFYTVGLTVAGLPELACYGVGDEAAAAGLLDAAARHMVECGELMPGDRIAGPAGRGPLVIIDMEDTKDFVEVRRLYGAVMAARQVVWPDPAGNFPWQMAWSLGPVQPMAGEPPF